MSVQSHRQAILRASDRALALSALKEYPQAQVARLIDDLNALIKAICAQNAQIGFQEETVGALNNLLLFVCGLASSDLRVTAADGLSQLIGLSKIRLARPLYAAYLKILRTEHIDIDTHKRPLNESTHKLCLEHLFALLPFLDKTKLTMIANDTFKVVFRALSWIDKELLLTALSNSIPPFILLLGPFFPASDCERFLDYLLLQYAKASPGAQRPLRNILHRMGELRLHCSLDFRMFILTALKHAAEKHTAPEQENPAYEQGIAHLIAGVQDSPQSTFLRLSLFLDSDSPEPLQCIMKCINHLHQQLQAHTSTQPSGEQQQLSTQALISKFESLQRFCAFIPFSEIFATNNHCELNELVNKALSFYANLMDSDAFKVWKHLLKRAALAAYAALLDNITMHRIPPQTVASLLDQVMIPQNLPLSSMSTHQKGKSLLENAQKSSSEDLRVYCLLLGKAGYYCLKQNPIDSNAIISRTINTCLALLNQVNNSKVGLINLLEGLATVFLSLTSDQDALILSELKTCSQGLIVKIYQAAISQQIECHPFFLRLALSLPFVDLDLDQRNSFFENLIQYHLAEISLEDIKTFLLPFLLDRYSPSLQSSLFKKRSIDYRRIYLLGLFLKRRTEIKEPTTILDFIATSQLFKIEKNKLFSMELREKLACAIYFDLLPDFANHLSFNTCIISFQEGFVMNMFITRLAKLNIFEMETRPLYPNIYDTLFSFLMRQLNLLNNTIASLKPDPCLIPSISTKMDHQPQCFAINDYQEKHTFDDLIQLYDIHGTLLWTVDPVSAYPESLQHLARQYVVPQQSNFVYMQKYLKSLFCAIRALIDHQNLSINSYIEALFAMLPNLLPTYPQYVFPLINSLMSRTLLRANPFFYLSINSLPFAKGFDTGVITSDIKAQPSLNLFPSRFSFVLNKDLPTLNILPTVFNQMVQNMSFMDLQTLNHHNRHSPFDYPEVAEFFKNNRPMLTLHFYQVAKPSFNTLNDVALSAFVDFCYTRAIFSPNGQVQDGAVSFMGCLLYLSYFYNKREFPASFIDLYGEYIGQLIISSPHLLNARLLKQFSTFLIFLSMHFPEEYALKVINTLESLVDLLLESQPSPLIPRNEPNLDQMQKGASIQYFVYGLIKPVIIYLYFNLSPQTKNNKMATLAKKTRYFHIDGLFELISTDFLPVKFAKLVLKIYASRKDAISNYKIITCVQNISIVQLVFRGCLEDQMHHGKFLLENQHNIFIDFIRLLYKLQRAQQEPQGSNYRGPSSSSTKTKKIDFNAMHQFLNEVLSLYSENSFSLQSILIPFTHTILLVFQGMLEIYMKEHLSESTNKNQNYILLLEMNQLRDLIEPRIASQIIGHTQARDKVIAIFDSVTKAFKTDLDGKEEPAYLKLANQDQIPFQTENVKAHLYEKSCKDDNDVFFIWDNPPLELILRAVGLSSSEKESILLELLQNATQTSVSPIKHDLLVFMAKIYACSLDVYCEQIYHPSFRVDLSLGAYIKSLVTTLSSIYMDTLYTNDPLLHQRLCALHYIRSDSTSESECTHCRFLDAEINRATLGKLYLETLNRLKTQLTEILIRAESFTSPLKETRSRLVMISPSQFFSKILQAFDLSQICSAYNIFSEYNQTAASEQESLHQRIKFNAFKKTGSLDQQGVVDSQVIFAHKEFLENSLNAVFTEFMGLINDGNDNDRLGCEQKLKKAIYSMLDHHFIFAYLSFLVLKHIKGHVDFKTDKTRFAIASAQCSQVPLELFNTIVIFGPKIVSARRLIRWISHLVTADNKLSTHSFKSLDFKSYKQFLLSLSKIETHSNDVDRYQLATCLQFLFEITEKQQGMATGLNTGHESSNVMNNNTLSIDDLDLLSALFHSIIAVIAPSPHALQHLASSFQRVQHRLHLCEKLIGAQHNRSQEKLDVCYQTLFCKMKAHFFYVFDKLVPAEIEHALFQSMYFESDPNLSLQAFIFKEQILSSASNVSFLLDYLHANLQETLGYFGNSFVERFFSLCLQSFSSALISTRFPCNLHYLGSDVLFQSLISACNGMCDENYHHPAILFGKDNCLLSDSHVSSYRLNNLLNFGMSNLYFSKRNACSVLACFCPEEAAFAFSENVPGYSPLILDICALLVRFDRETKQIFDKYGILCMFDFLYVYLTLYGVRESTCCMLYEIFSALKIQNLVIKHGGPVVCACLKVLCLIVSFPTEKPNLKQDARDHYFEGMLRFLISFTIDVSLVCFKLSCTTNINDSSYSIPINLQKIMYHNRLLKTDLSKLLVSRAKTYFDMPTFAYFVAEQNMPPSKPLFSYISDAPNIESGALTENEMNNDKLDVELYSAMSASHISNSILSETFWALKCLVANNNASISKYILNDIMDDLLSLVDLVLTRISAHHETFAHHHSPQQDIKNVGSFKKKKRDLPDEELFTSVIHFILFLTKKYPTKLREKKYHFRLAKFGLDFFEQQMLSSNKEFLFANSNKKEDCFTAGILHIVRHLFYFYPDLAAYLGSRVNVLEKFYSFFKGALYPDGYFEVAKAYYKLVLTVKSTMSGIKFMDVVSEFLELSQRAAFFSNEVEKKAGLVPLVMHLMRFYDLKSTMVALLKAFYFFSPEFHFKFLIDVVSEYLQRGSTTTAIAHKISAELIFEMKLDERTAAKPRIHAFHLAIAHVMDPEIKLQSPGPYFKKDETQFEVFCSPEHFKESLDLYIGKRGLNEKESTDYKNMFVQILIN